MNHMMKLLIKKLSVIKDGMPLYFNICQKACLKKCKGPKKGWHPSEYGCEIISTFGHECSDYKCKYKNHRFKDSYIIKENVTKTKDVIKYKFYENAVQSEDEKKEIRENKKK